MKVSVPLHVYLLVGLKQLSADHVLVTSWLVGALCLYFSFDLMSDPVSSDHAALGGLTAFVGVLHMVNTGLHQDFKQRPVLAVGEQDTEMGQPLQVIDNVRNRAVQHLFAGVIHRKGSDH